MNKNKLIILIVSIISVLVIGISVTLISLFFAGKTKVDFFAAQEQESSYIYVKWETDKNVDEVIIEVSKGGKIISRKTINSKKDLKLCNYKIKGTYGENKVKLTIKNKLFKRSVTRTVNVYRY